MSRHSVHPTHRSRPNGASISESIRVLALRTLGEALLVAVKLEYRLHTSVVATAGTKVMLWLSVPGRFFYQKGIGSGIGFDQFIALKVSIAFFKFSYLFFKITHASQMRALALGGLRSLLLHGEHMGADMRKLNRQFIGSRRDLRIIERLYCRLVGAETLGEGRDHIQNVHGSLLSGDESIGVGATDSTGGSASTKIPEERV